MNETTKKIMKAYAILAGAAAACALGFWGVDAWEEKSHDKTRAEEAAREAQREVERLGRLLEDEKSLNRSLRVEADRLRSDNIKLTIKGTEVKPKEATGGFGN